MVQRITWLAAAKPTEPIAMIIGAAHTAEVSEALKKDGSAFAVLSPNDLNSATATLPGEPFERKQAAKWAWDAPGTLGSLLNRQSSPITQTATGKSHANMGLAGLLIAHPARANKPLPRRARPRTVWSR